MSPLFPSACCQDCHWPRTNLLGQCKALWIGNGCQLLLLQLLNGVLVISKVQLGSHEDDGGAGTVVSDLREPLARDQDLGYGWKRPHKHMRKAKRNEKTWLLLFLPKQPYRLS